MPYEPRPRSPRGFGGGPEGGFAGSAPTFGGGASPAPASGPTVDAVVKWFKADKGYGFVELAAARVTRSCTPMLCIRPGTNRCPRAPSSRVVVGAGAKGAQVTVLSKVDAAGVVEQPRRAFSDRPGGDRGDAPRPPRRMAPDPSTAVAVTAR